MTTPTVLTRLLTAPGPPGHEQAPAAVWREAAEQFADDVTVDAMGNSVARVGGRGDHPLLAVVGHIDEIGLLVSHISDKGFLHVVGTGGWDPQVLVGQRVEVIARSGSIPGVVGRKPIHVLESEERKKAVELKGLHVDIGASDGEEARTPSPSRCGATAWYRARSTTAWASTWRSRWLAASARPAGAPARSPG